MKTTKIKVETERTLIVRCAQAAMGWCPVCGQHREFILLGNPASLEPLIATRLREWMKTGDLHFSIQENGLTRICFASLLCCFELEGNPEIQINKEII